MALLKLLGLVLREALSAPRLERRPEPSPVMDDLEAVRAFHAQGDAAGPLLPVYHLNALAMSRALRRGATVLDLGCGSGQYLRYLAGRRPDLRLIGLDLSEEMVRLGRAGLEQDGLAGRLSLRVGDMTGFKGRVSERVDLISCIFALHHLPSLEDVRRCLGQLSEARRQSGCGVWIFDHVRPQHPGTPADFAEVFHPGEPEVFRRDSANSLVAAWSFEELRGLLEQASPHDFCHAQSLLLRLYQAHWTEPMASGHAGAWVPRALSPKAERQARALRMIFKTTGILG